MLAPEALGGLDMNRREFIPFSKARRRRGQGLAAAVRSRATRTASHSADAALPQPRTDADRQARVGTLSGKGGNIGLDHRPQCAVRQRRWVTGQCPRTTFGRQRRRNGPRLAPRPSSVVHGTSSSLAPLLAG